MKPKRLIPMGAMIPSYVLSISAVVVAGATALEWAAANAGALWVTIGAAVMMGLIFLTVVGVTHYWRTREIEEWVFATFPSDSERDTQMRHDLVHGSPQCK